MNRNSDLYSFKDFGKCGCGSDCHSPLFNMALCLPIAKEDSPVLAQCSIAIFTNISLPFSSKVPVLIFLVIISPCFKLEISFNKPHSVKYGHTLVIVLPTNHNRTLCRFLSIVLYRFINLSGSSCIYSERDINSSKIILVTSRYEPPA